MWVGLLVPVRGNFSKYFRGKFWSPLLFRVSRGQHFIKSWVGETTLFLWVSVACDFSGLLCSQACLLLLWVLPRINRSYSLKCHEWQFHHIREMFLVKGQLGNRIHKFTSWSSQVPSWSLLLALPGSLDFFFRLIIIAFAESLLETCTVCVLIYLIDQQPYERGDMIIPTLLMRKMRLGKGESWGCGHRLWGTELVSRLQHLDSESCTQLYALWLTLLSWCFTVRELRSSAVWWGSLPMYF